MLVVRLLCAHSVAWIRAWGKCPNNRECDHIGRAGVRHAGTPDNVDMSDKMSHSSACAHQRRLTILVLACAPRAVPMNLNWLLAQSHWISPLQFLSLPPLHLTKQPSNSELSLRAASDKPDDCGLPPSFSGPILDPGHSIPATAGSFVHRASPGAYPSVPKQ